MEANEAAGGVPVYVLNRDAASDRLVAVWADAERLGLRLLRVPEEALEDDARARIAAHISAWSRIAGGETEFAIVAEDDIDLDERLLPLLDVTMLAREFDGPTVINLDGGPVDGSGPARVVIAKQRPRSFGAYIINRSTAAYLFELVDPRSTLPDLESVLADGGVTTLVATPAPAAGPASSEPDAEELGTLRRFWRRLRRPHSNDQSSLARRAGGAGLVPGGREAL